MPLEAPTGRSGPSERRVREQLARMLRHPDFLASPRTSAFLKHIAERTLAGRSDEIKESTIGVEVFGRPPGYDAKADSIVRSEARRLREKLAHYYAGEGAGDTLRIEVPKGTYVPEFRSLAEEPDTTEEAGRTANSGRLAGILLAAAVVGAAVVLLAWNQLSAGHTEGRVVLAVLPFAHASAPDFDAAVTEDLERDLARIRSLRIHARPPADLLDPHEELDYRALAKKLGVDVLLDGRIVRSAAGASIHVSLIRGADSSLLWTDHFDASAPTRAVERQIEDAVARTLGMSLPMRTQPENPRAHDLFLEGRALWATRRKPEIERALAAFEQALQVDPGYALAYMGIADAYGLMAVHGQIDEATGVERGERAARKAIELDPSLAEAYAALGLLECAQWRWQEADEQYRRAIEFNPSYDRAYSRAGVVRFYLGDFPAAERYMREAETLDPYSTALPLIRANCTITGAAMTIRCI